MAVDSGLPRADLEQRAIERLPSDIRRPFDSVDAALAGFMERYGITILRFALAVVFIWFGALKVVGESPVEDLVTDTVYWMTGTVWQQQQGVSGWGPVPPLPEAARET